MTSIASPAPDTQSVEIAPRWFKLAIALVLAALADWLFYGERVGISVVVFAIALVLGSLLANFAALSRSRAALGAVVIVAGLVPAVEEVNAASLVILILALGIALIVTIDPAPVRLGERAAALLDLFLVGPFRFFRDAPRAFHLPALASGLVVWLVPALLGTIFICLFVAANPVLEKWIQLFNPGEVASQVSVGRTLFWIVAMALVWPFIHLWRRAMVASSPDPDGPDAQTAARSSGIALLGAPTILRSLILFNLLFAVQTALDAAYLWGNATLPADVTYASYAHRGAYPLIATALLAAGFVLVAMRPGGPAEKSSVIRWLVYLWVAQNVMMVASSILRLDIYVQIYLLTYWRIAAFIWMMLVAIGLLLILARIALNRSNEWLIRANLITLTAVIYVSSLVNFASIIADYNVSHSREVSGKGVQMDTYYLSQLGPQALPAMEKAMQIQTVESHLVSRRDSLLDEHRRDMVSWRTWGFRSWRLQHYLDTQKNAATG
ncbi:MAG: DUF4173 domain-containing protein [Bradyrhizobium sp.]|uniref:DUF4153 domain-containing protein n=1 Tax=Bradyrhizobium sp. TaxID=376 RepID=UPI0025BAA278|nr:DUF4173 domain-containing protein [Bradyrhizobium sp.]MBI5264741.1 DUF4173 domain-containing protein [Bradyrhizobium sp.]